MNENSNGSTQGDAFDSRHLDTLFSAIDWSKSPLGMPVDWPESLHVMLRVVLQAPMPMLILWGKEMVQVYNDAYSMLVTQTAPQTIGMPLKMAWPEAWHRMSAPLESVLQHGRPVILHNDPFILPEEAGSQRLFWIALSPLFDATQSVEGILVCLTEQQAGSNKAGAAPGDIMQHASAYQKMISEIQDYSIILLDRQGIIRNWNQGAEQIKQYTQSEAVGQYFDMLYPEEDRQRGLPVQLLEQAVRDGRVLYEGWCLRKDGTRFWGSITLTAIHDEADEVIGFSKVSRDVTDRKLNEDRLNEYTAELQQQNDLLRKSEERYHQMIAEVQDYAIILLNNRGEIQNWNAGAEKIKGYLASEIIGESFKIFYTADDRLKRLPEQLLQAAMETGRALHEGWRVRKDGTKFWGSIVISALHGDDGGLIGFSKVTRDLTERKLAEDKMRQYMLELESQNRELEQFAYIASHDLQEPLRKIRMFAEVIESNFGNEKMTLDYFAKIKNSVERMTQLIRSILNYSKLSENEQEPVPTDLNEILMAVRGDLELMIHDKDAVITLEKLPVIQAIPSQVTQLFANLLNNALKFNDGTPAIHISSRIVDSQAITDFPPHAKIGNYYEIEVGDNGIGFEQRYAERIFSMFQRLHGKHQYAGTGIGLALCKKIMDIHGGFITARSEAMQGAHFFVYFPAAE